MKKLILALVVLSITGMIQAQNLRHVKGISLIGVTYGISPGSDASSNLYGISFTRYLKQKISLNITGLYESGEVSATVLKNYLLDAGLDYNVFKVNNFMYFNLGLSVMLGAENLSNNENSEKKNALFYGGAANANIEFYLTDRIVFQVKAQENYTPGSKLGNWYPTILFGLKFCIL